eukprot:4916459-Prorocentrum_lima.AAC.1
MESHPGHAQALDACLELKSSLMLGWSHTPVTPSPWILMRAWSHTPLLPIRLMLACSHTPVTPNPVMLSCVTPQSRSRPPWG